ncbi:MAG: hypothetical protein ACYC2G_08880 [Gemmatimonadaceae bacterium]
MTAPPRKNAIEQRLEELDDRWNTFVEAAGPRLLRWAADAESRQLIDGWVQLQCDGDGALPDFFLRLEAPFAAPATHGFALLQSLYAQVEMARTELAGEGEELEWSVPAVRPGEADVSALVRCCAAFQAHYQSRILKLGVAITPTEVLDAAGWPQWLRFLLQSGVPDTVRFLVVDPAEAPLLDGLAAAEPVLVASEPMDLDMAAARADLAAGAATDDPGSQFRVHFVALTNAVGKGDLPAAHDAAQRALAMAGEHGWMAMQVVVYVALGSGYVGGGHTDHALSAYRSARQAAHGAAEQGDPAAPKLVVQSWFGEGTALVGAGRFAEAAVVYMQAAPVATDAGDPLMTLEAWRMAAYCHEQAGDADASWSCGHAALDAGERLDEAMRAASTLPFVGQGLLRLTRQWSYGGQVDAVRGRMTALLGPDWERRAPQPAQTA